MVMPSYTYRGDPRVYPDLGLEVVDGDVVDLAEAPQDGRWSANPASTPPPATPAPEASMPPIPSPAPPSSAATPPPAPQPDPTTKD